MSSSRQAAAPVLSLFRRVMRLHGRLPPPMRSMGDAYARDEFRRHLRGKTTAQQWRAFVEEWDRYCDLLAPREGEAEPVGQAAGAASTVEEARSVPSESLSPEELERLVTLSGELPEAAAQSLSPEQRARLERLREEALRFGQGLFPEKPDQTK